jgi:hypothetical protein
VPTATFYLNAGELQVRADDTIRYLYLTDNVQRHLALGLIANPISLSRVEIPLLDTGDYPPPMPTPTLGSFLPGPSAIEFWD